MGCLCVIAIYGAALGGSFDVLLGLRTDGRTRFFSQTSALDAPTLNAEAIAETERAANVGFNRVGNTGLDLELRPSAAASVNFPRLEARITYAPRYLMRYPRTRGHPLLQHQGELVLRQDEQAPQYIAAETHWRVGEVDATAAISELDEEGQMLSAALSAPSFGIASLRGKAELGMRWRQQLDLALHAEAGIIDALSGAPPFQTWPRQTRFAAGTRGRYASGPRAQWQFDLAMSHLTVVRANASGYWGVTPSMHWQRRAGVHQTWRVRAGVLFLRQLNVVTPAAASGTATALFLGEVRGESVFWSRRGRRLSGGWTLGMVPIEDTLWGTVSPRTYGAGHVSYRATRDLTAVLQTTLYGLVSLSAHPRWGWIERWKTAQHALQALVGQLVVTYQMDTNKAVVGGLMWTENWVQQASKKVRPPGELMATLSIRADFSAL